MADTNSTPTELADADGYPTPEFLKLLRGREASPRACNELLDMIADAWWMPDFGVKRSLTAHEGYVVHADKESKHLRLATAGWSGNEDIILNFRMNHLAWSLCWELSAKGGLHIFRYQVPA